MSLQFEVVDLPDEGITTLSDEELDADVWLSVPQFAAQPEVDKHPSQIYGWLKRGLPFEMVDGQKRINFKAGVEWIQERQSMTRQAKVDRARTVGVAGRGILSKVVADVEAGAYLRWDRQNDLGPAYAMVTGFTGGLVILSVEYRSCPVYFGKEQLLRDISKGVVRIVHPTEVYSFLLQEISRLDFFVHTFVGPEKGREFSLLLRDCELIPLDLAERFHGFSRRPRNAWPGAEALEDLETAVKVAARAAEEEEVSDE